MLQRAVLWIWKPCSLERNRRLARRNEIPFQADSAILGKLLRALIRPEGIDAPGLEIFQENPFDPRLRPHKIYRLSARFNRTIYAADIEGDLRAVFYVEGDVVITVDIGSHDIYRG